MVHLFPDFPALVFSDTTTGEGGLQDDMRAIKHEDGEDEFGKKRAFEQR